MGLGVILWTELVLLFFFFLSKGLDFIGTVLLQPAPRLGTLNKIKNTLRLFAGASSAHRRRQPTLPQPGFS
ncbi:hypothetical protein Q6247_25655, partial [Klebsiella pneumoniae]